MSKIADQAAPAAAPTASAVEPEARPAAPVSPVPDHVVEPHYAAPEVCPRCNGCQSVDSVKGLPWNRPRLVAELPGVRTGAVYPVECPDCRVAVPVRKKK